MASVEAPGEGFEQTYRRLEETVGSLERGGLSLEEALARFEEGMRLAERCAQLLEQAELRVTRLLAENGLAGQLDPEPPEDG